MKQFERNLRGEIVVIINARPIEDIPEGIFVKERKPIQVNNCYPKQYKKKFQKGFGGVKK